MDNVKNKTKYFFIFVLQGQEVHLIKLMKLYYKFLKMDQNYKVKVGEILIYINKKRHYQFPFSNIPPCFANHISHRGNMNYLTVKEQLKLAVYNLVKFNV